MESEERDWWVKFLKDYAIAEIEYAFDEWVKNRGRDEWWPTAGRISQLCGEYRRLETQKILPIGCYRCDWTGWYETTGKTAGSIVAYPGTEQLYAGKEVKAGRIERLVAACPCQTDASLRTPVAKKMASEEEMRVMWTLVKEMCEKTKFPEEKKEPERKQWVKLLPTTKELAEQLSADQAKRGVKPGERAEIERYRRRMEEE